MSPQTPRAIVRDDHILSGRWRFEGTTIPVAAIRSDFHYGRKETKAQYKFMDLTDQEIDAALAFVFPEVRDHGLTVQYASMQIECVCGEDVSLTKLRPSKEIISCVCGRRWRISVTSQLEDEGVLTPGLPKSSGKANGQSVSAAGIMVKVTADGRPSLPVSISDAETASTQPLVRRSISI